MQQKYFNNQRIFTSLASELTQLLEEEVIITNELGVIIASTDLKRIDDFHEGAKLVMEKEKEMHMTKEMTETLMGVRKGVVLPIINNNEPIATLGITGEPKEVALQAQLVKRIAELFIQDTMYQRDKENQARNLELFVFNWLNHATSKENLLESSNFFKIDMQAYKQVILFKTEDTTINLSYQDISFLRTLWDQKKDGVFVRWGEGRWLLLVKDLPENMLNERLKYFIKNVKERMNIRIFAGCGQVITEESLDISFEQAKRASDISGPDTPIVFEEELRLEIIFSELSEGIQDDFINRTIQSLITETYLIETLEAWFKNDMSPGKTADNMYVHKNTLHYRLRRIEELTDLKLYKVEDLVSIYLAYQFFIKKKE